jgi:hypothetical protein
MGHPEDAAYVNTKIGHAQNNRPRQRKIIADRRAMSLQSIMM